METSALVIPFDEREDLNADGVVMADRQVDACRAVGRVVHEDDRIDGRRVNCHRPKGHPGIHASFDGISIEPPRPVGQWTDKSLPNYWWVRDLAPSTTEAATD